MNINMKIIVEMWINNNSLKSKAKNKLSISYPYIHKLNLKYFYS